MVSENKKLKLFFFKENTQGKREWKNESGKHSRKKKSSSWFFSPSKLPLNSSPFEQYILPLRGALSFQTPKKLNETHKTNREILNPFIKPWQNQVVLKFGRVSRKISSHRLPFGHIFSPLP